MGVGETFINPLLLPLLREPASAGFSGAFRASHSQKKAG